ncbi:hypothetical protein NKR23_g2144 [Pleurostoma richardsiae]|uniref:Uncharacterized protein n=1 Tax=Pleurostoma richardsiae TaxID=41990 RepID=A0AA38RQ10_9PEZI|nr:hypothetical protein NKR23_g2144 [Pleurostoma richardsiae]
MTIKASFLLGYVIARFRIESTASPFLESILADVHPKIDSTLFQYLAIVEQYFHVGRINGGTNGHISIELDILTRALHIYDWSCSGFFGCPARTFGVEYKILPVDVDDTSTFRADIQYLLPPELVRYVPPDFDEYGKDRTAHLICAAVGFGLGAKNFVVPSDTICEMGVKTALQLARRFGDSANPRIPRFAPPPVIGAWDGNRMERGAGLPDCAIRRFQQPASFYHKSCFLIGYALARCRYKNCYIDLLNSLEDLAFKSTLAEKLDRLEEHFDMRFTFPGDHESRFASRSMNVYERALSDEKNVSAPSIYEPWFTDKPDFVNLGNPREIWNAIRQIIPADPCVPIHEPRNLDSCNCEDMACLVYTMVGIGLARRGRYLSNQTIRNLNLGLAVQIGFFAVDNGPMDRSALPVLPSVPTKKGLDSAVMNTLSNVDRNTAAMKGQFEGFLKEYREERCSWEGSSAQESADEQMSLAIDGDSGGETSVAKGDRKDDTWFDLSTDCVDMNDDCAECT